MATPSLLLIPDRYKASKLYSQIPDSGAGDLSFTRVGDTATRVNASGLIENVLANIPRIDFTGGGCGKLLLEPQRTNLYLRSEQINDAAWVKVAGTVTENNSLAPDGAMTADTFTADGTNASHRFFQAVTAVSGTTYRVSYYVKRGTAEYVQIAISGAIPFGVTNFANFDLLLGVVGTTGGNQTNSQISYNAATGYYRISSQITATGSGAGQIDLVIVSSASAPRLQAWVTSQSIVCWGAQLEVGSYATSYIPTTSATVTRGADVCSKTGISSLLGGTEGTWFLEMKYQPISSSPNPTMSVSSLSSQIGIASSGVNSLRVRINAVNDIIASANPTNRHKIAISFNASGVVCFFNGVQLTLPNGASQVVSGLDQVNLENGTRHNDIEIYQMAYYQNTLSNAELQTLTTL